MAVRWCLALLVSALSLGRLEAEGSPLSVEVSTGIVVGGAGELVFDPIANRNENDPISLLTWPVPPAFQLGLAGNWTWTPWTTTSVRLQGSWAPLPQTMTDEDWRTQTDSGFLVYGRSQSDAFLMNHWSGVVEQSFRGGGFTWGGGGLYRTTQWEAWGGTKRYEFSSKVEEAQFNGLVLEYRQIWLIPFLSAGWTGTWDRWSLTPSLRLSPFTWCFDTDNHMFASKRVTYLDNLRGGWFAEAALELTFTPLPGLTTGVRGAFSTARGAVGETYTVTPTSTPLGTSLSVKPSANAAGGWFQEATLMLFMRN